MALPTFWYWRTVVKAGPRPAAVTKGAAQAGLVLQTVTKSMKLFEVVVEVGARQGEALPLEIEAQLLAEVRHRLQVGIDRRVAGAAGEDPVHLVHARRREVAVDRAAQGQLVAGVELEADPRIEARRSWRWAPTFRVLEFVVSTLAFIACQKSPRTPTVMSIGMPVKR